MIHLWKYISKARLRRARSYKIQKACDRGNKSHDQPDLSLLISSLSLSICLFPSDRRGLRWSTRHEIRRRDAAWGDRPDGAAAARCSARQHASARREHSATRRIPARRAPVRGAVAAWSCGCGAMFLFFIWSAASRPWKFISRGQPRYPLLQIVFVAAIT